MHVMAHPLIHRGTTVPGKGLAEIIQEAEARGATAAEIDKVEADWLAEHPLCTFNTGTNTPILIGLIR